MDLTKYYRYNHFFKIKEVKNLVNLFLTFFVLLYPWANKITIKLIIIYMDKYISKNKFPYSLVHSTPLFENNSNIHFSYFDNLPSIHLKLIL